MSGGREKDKARGSEENKDKKPRQTDGIYPFLDNLLQAVKWEVYSPAGRANILFDLVLAAIIVVYILAGTIPAVTRVVASIFNGELTSQAGDNIFGLLAVFMAAFLLCLFVIHITRKENDYFEEYKQRHEDNGKQ